MNIFPASTRRARLSTQPRLLLACLLLSLSTAIQAQPAFTVIPLGVRGGLDESNLSAYIVAAGGSQDYICLDAGTLYTGLQKAVDNHLFQTTPGAVLRFNIKGYFISHPHLDHVAGLIINSPDDTAKNIYGLPSCLSILQDKYFSWKSWANFGDEGEKPQLKKYHYVPMEPGKEIPAANTTLFVQAFSLSHGNPFESTAFLVRNGTASLLYFGDTGADSVEHTDKLHNVWQAVAPLIKTRRLKAIFIEVSFPDEQPIRSLFGHLTPPSSNRNSRPSPASPAPTPSTDSPSSSPTANPSATRNKPSGANSSPITPFT